jgi:small subunit ribosomal protein S4
MARHTGPRLRIIRRIGTELPGLTTKTAARRPNPPGHAAAQKRQFKISEYGQRLREKQKLRYHYGLTERSLVQLYQKAYRTPGDTGRNLLALLEARFDNIVWRSGLSRTIPGARQLITHGHVNLNGRRAKSPGQQLSVGDVFQVRESSRNREDIRLTVNGPVLERPTGLKVDLDTVQVTVEALPGADNIPFSLDMQKVIEFFAK